MFASTGMVQMLTQKVSSSFQSAIKLIFPNVCVLLMAKGQPIVLFNISALQCVCKRAYLGNF